jgi:hypothetical protein
MVTIFSFNILSLDTYFCQVICSKNSFLPILTLALFHTPIQNFLGRSDFQFPAVQDIVFRVSGQPSETDLSAWLNNSSSDIPSINFFFPVLLSINIPKPLCVLCGRSSSPIFSLFQPYYLYAHHPASRSPPTITTSSPNWAWTRRVLSP